MTLGTLVGKERPKKCLTLLNQISSADCKGDWGTSKNCFKVTLCSTNVSIKKKTKRTIKRNETPKIPLT